MVTKTTLARFSWCISPGVAKQNTAPLSLVTDEDNHGELNMKENAEASIYTVPNRGRSCCWQPTGCIAYSAVIACGTHPVSVSGKAQIGIHDTCQWEQRRAETSRTAH